jgi:hypothetical protein
MTQEEIKTAKEKFFEQIKSAENSLEELRKVCLHPNEEEVTWSWRIACYDQAYICADCGKFLRYKENFMNDWTITTTEDDRESYTAD